MLGKFLDGGADIKTAIQNLIETKLIGTWRMSIMLVSEPNKVYVTKNAGPFYMGQSSSSIVLCSDQGILTSPQQAAFTFKKLRNNILYEITDECSVSET